MKRAASFVIALALLCSVSPTDAGARPDKEWKDVFGHFSAGWSVPQSDLDRIVGSDLYLNGGVTYWPTSSSVGLNFDLAYTDMDFKKSAIDAINDQIPPGEGEITGGDIDLWSLSANAIWGPDGNGPFGFYLIAGIGADYLNARITETGLVYYPPICDPWWGWCIPGGVGPGTIVVGKFDDWAFGWNAGFGLTFDGRGGSQYFLEARYKVSETDPRSTVIVPIVFGVRW